MTATELKTTPLNGIHRARGAKMVAFAGWDMPLHYGSQVEEHHRVRRHAGMFDVSHMLAIDVRGAAARVFLRRLLAADVGRLELPGTAAYSCLLNASGGVIDDLIAYFLAEDWFRLVVNAGGEEKDRAWISARAAEVAPGIALVPRRDLAIIAVQGPKARELVARALPGAADAARTLHPFQAMALPGVFLARTGYTGEDGCELMLDGPQAESVWRALEATGVAPAGLGARDTLRLEAGMRLAGQDMDESVTPLEAGLDWTVDLTANRDFFGRAALAAQTVRARLVGLVLTSRGIMRRHQAVRTAAGPGEVTSGGFGPTVNRSIALARVPIAVSAGEEVEVAVRDRWLSAKVVKPPFVRHGQVVIAR